MAGAIITYVDHPVDGQLNSAGNLAVLTNANALNNALTQWLSSCSNDFIRSNSGGVIMPYLDKPMDEGTASDMKTAIIVGLSKDFLPSIQVRGVDVIPNLKSDTWDITITGYCASLKTIVQYSQSFRSLR